MNISNDLKLAVRAAEKAAELIRERYNKDYSIRVKEDKSLVTEVDIAAEKIIIDTLSSTYPILSEETNSSIEPSKDTYWAVDPLDGTTDFIRQIPIFCVSIALIKKNKPTIGVILNPVTKELFYSEQNKGAFLNGKRINVGSKTKLAFINSGYGLENKMRSVEVLKKIIPEFWFRHFGSTAYELATVASGKVDAFICYGDQLWDHAAGISILKEAGGIVTDWKGNEWTTKIKYVLAANPNAYKKIQPLISNLQK